MAALKPKLDALSAEARSFYKTGERNSASLIMKKHKRLRASNGLFPAVTILTLFTVPVHMVNFSMVNYFARTPEHYMHQLLQDQGFLWFPNLMLPDPFFALPLLACSLTALNIHSMQTI